MTSTTNVRQSYTYLRSVCRDFSERMTLGDAIKNGWNADTITKLAEESRDRFRGYRAKENAYQHAIRKAASTRFVSDDEKALHLAEMELLRAEVEARRAIKANKDNRPSVPLAFQPFLTACQNMEDCAALTTVIAGGWSASDLWKIAEGFGRGVSGKPTPLSLRLAVSTAGGNSPGEHILLRTSKNMNADLHNPTA